VSDIRATIDYEGVERGAQQLDRLVEGLGDVASAEERAARATARFENAVDGSRTAVGRMDAPLRSAAAGHATVGRASNAAGRKFAETLNIVSELTLGMGALSPKLRETGIAFAGAGNNAVQFAGMGIGPAGIAIGTLVAVLPALIAYLSDTGDEMERTADSAERVAFNTERMISSMRRAQTLQNIQRGRASEDALAGEAQGSIQERITQEELFQQQANQALATYTTQLEAIQARRAEGSASALRELRVAEASMDELRRGIRESRERMGSLREEQDTLLMRALRQEAQGAFDDDEDSPRRRRRGGSRRQRQGLTEDQRMAADLLASLDEEAERRRIIEEGRQAARARERDAQQQILDLKAFEIELDERAAARKEELAERRIEQIEKEKQAALAADEERMTQLRGAMGRVEEVGTALVGVFNDAFRAAIEGEQSFEDAFAAGMKGILTQIGDRLVAEGIGEILHGLTMSVTNPPAAATKIGGGTAMVAFGVGLGAAGAAIPSGGAAAPPPESPREDQPDREGEGGPQVLNLYMNAPITTAQTNASLSRTLRRQIDAGRQFTVGG
jgi:hypothetical protein